MLNRQQLYTLDSQKEKVIFGRITTLTQEELPIEQIEGKVAAGGSISIDGASALRRTCSLTLLIDSFNFIEQHWALKTKFKLEIGIANFVLPNQPDIIWFNQGIYIITSFNYSYTTNSYKISISGKDKMCLLNGEVNGALMFETDFGCIEEEDKEGNWTTRQIPIEEIIRNLVHEYAGEPYHKIIIKDLPEYGFELLEYQGNQPLYLYSLRNEGESFNGFFNNLLTNGNIPCKVIDQPEPTTLDKLDNYYFVPLLDDIVDQSQPIEIEENQYWVAKISTGQTGGYKLIDLVYQDTHLIAKVGESLTSVLDKLVKMLGEYEYFYDIDGRFVFQQKQSYLKTMYTPNINNDTSILEIEENQYVYTFDNNDLLISLNKTTNLNNIKNDYSIWGERKTMNDVAIPIHYRFAIDNKPLKYTSITIEDNHPDILAYNEQYNTLLSGQKGVTYIFSSDLKFNEDKTIIECDWREVVYRMAADYFKYHSLDCYSDKLKQANPDYELGTTGYEQYYTDIQGFWRELYILPWELAEEYDREYHKLITMVQEGPLENTEQAAEKYKADIESQKQIIKNLQDKQNSYNAETGWLKAIIEAPETLNFWFDFLDVDGELNQYSVKQIGIRSKPINDTNIKSIYFRETPNVLIVNDIALDDPKFTSAYTFIQIPNYENMFVRSAQGKSAKNELDSLLYQHTYSMDQISITAIPMYHLQPNSRIYINDTDTQTTGDYIISKITYNLNYNGTMSITATKAASDIL